MRHLRYFKLLYDTYEMHFFTILEQCVDHKVFEAFAASIYLLNASIRIVHSSLG